MTPVDLLHNSGFENGLYELTESSLSDLFSQRVNETPKGKGAFLQTISTERGVQYYIVLKGGKGNVGLGMVELTPTNEKIIIGLFGSDSSGITAYSSLVYINPEWRVSIDEARGSLNLIYKLLKQGHLLMSSRNFPHNTWLVEEVIVPNAEKYKGRRERVIRTLLQFGYEKREVSGKVFYVKRLK